MIPAVTLRTSAFFIDDERDFISDLIEFLPNTHEIEIFTDPLEAIDELARRPKICAEQVKQDTATGPSVLIVDHCMMPIDGIEFCNRTKDHRAKRIMLTSRFSKDEAIDALNQKIIDAYLFKWDVNISEKLAATIARCTRDFFIDLSKDMPDYKSSSNPLLNPSFTAFFDDFCRRHNVVEHFYFHDFHCLRLLTDEGTERFVTIYNDDQFEDLINSEQALSADAHTLDLLNKRLSAPCLRNINSPQMPDGAQWNSLLVPLLPIGNGLFVAVN